MGGAGWGRREQKKAKVCCGVLPDDTQYSDECVFLYSITHLWWGIVILFKCPSVYLLECPLVSASFQRSNFRRFVGVFWGFFFFVNFLETVWEY